MTKAFVLLSGGIDSAVCLQKAIREHRDVEAIHYDYGQQTETIERKNSEEQAESEGIPLHVINYRQVFKDFSEGTIEDQQYDKEYTENDGHSVGYVPQRNLHLLVTAAAVAEHNTKNGREIILYHGAQQNDEEDYPDCRPAFMKSAAQAVNRSTDQHEVRIETPIIDLSKEEVLRMGESLGVNWALTFSCYNDQDGEPCGECPACIERKQAFDKVEITDPIM
jgi:7-cyano-7-deazaguanine synthase